MPDQTYNNTKVILYYANWCAHCEEFLPEWEKLKSMIIDKNVEFLEFEESQHLQKMQDENIKGYPTIMIIIDGEKREYNGERTAKAIAAFIIKGETPDVKYAQCGGGSSHNKNGFSLRRKNNRMDEKKYKVKYLKYKAKFMKLRSELGI